MAFDILIVDDEQDICQLIGETLMDEGYKVRFAHDGPGAVQAARQRCPSLIILDIWLGDSRFDGIRVLEEVLASHPHVPVIMMSGHGTIETAVETIRKGAYDFVEKPFKMDRLLMAVKRAQEASHLKFENAELREQSFFHQSDFNQSVIPAAIEGGLRRAAASDNRILIRGEAGSGKNYAARRIHDLSSRSKSHFVRLDCGTLQEETFEESFFGRESDTEISLGALEKAHQGTLFLDHVDKLSLPLQEKLSAALEKLSFKRVQGKSEVSVDVRLIASVSCDLEDALEQGLFLKSLQLRLCTVFLKMPPLRDRMEEIEKLVEAFSKAAAKSHSLPVKTLSKETYGVFRTYAWPGNLKQLKNAIDWFYVMKKDVPVVTPDHLPPDLAGGASSSPSDVTHIARLITLPLKEARMEFERDYLKAQVSRFSGNISSTASFVGMERSALHRKLKNLNITKAN